MVLWSIQVKYFIIISNFPNKSIRRMKQCKSNEKAPPWTIWRIEEFYAALMVMKGDQWVNWVIFYTIFRVILPNEVLNSKIFVPTESLHITYCFYNILIVWHQRYIEGIQVLLEFMALPNCKNTFFIELWANFQPK